ncbi:MAG: hypothetical protein AAF196_08050 [Planctomycetota bacterium]
MSELIARSHLCNLRVCCSSPDGEAEHLTLTVGAVSLHLDRETFRHVAWFLRKADHRVVMREEHGPGYAFDPDLRK